MKERPHGSQGESANFGSPIQFCGWHLKRDKSIFETCTVSYPISFFPILHLHFLGPIVDSESFSWIRDLKVADSPCHQLERKGSWVLITVGADRGFFLSVTCRGKNLWESISYIPHIRYGVLGECRYRGKGVSRNLGLHRRSHAPTLECGSPKFLGNGIERDVGIK